MNNQINHQTPAKLLSGRTLDNGWQVKELIDRPITSTGGYFSTSYIVYSPRGEKAFLKAMDYQRALESSDPAKSLETMTAAFNFERNLLEKCKSNRLSRIVRVLDGGTIAATPGDPSSVVQYLIFELADGDIRTYMKFGQGFDNAWVLRTLHHAAAALHQLHQVQIAHQDLKPSNVLIFENDHSKLGDLGTAYDLHSTSPNDALPCAGDLTYAPPELLYGHVDQDWRIRRLACDMYLLGSLIVYFYTGVSMTHLLVKRVNISHHYNAWGDRYLDVLPYLQHVFTHIIRELSLTIPEEFTDDVTSLVSQLCNPDPRERGHPKNKIASIKYSLERYVSKFDLLAKRAEWATRTNFLIKQVDQ